MIYGEVRDEWTEYAPPKSVSFGHQARRRDPQAAWAETTAFLERYTLFRPDPPEATVKSWPAGPLTSADASADGLRRASERFGDPELGLDGLPAWPVPSARIPEALHLTAETNRAWPDEPVPPLNVGMSFYFVWRRWLPPGAGPEESGTPAAGASRLGASIFRYTLFLQPRLLFPRPWNAAELASFLDELDETSPFRFRDPYFYRLLPSRDGRLTQARKLAKGWRASVARGEEGP